MSFQHYNPPSGLAKNLAEAPIPTHQAHQQQQQHFLTEENDRSTDVSNLMQIRRMVDLATHGVIAFLSVCAFGSIVSTMQFQSSLGYTSSTAVFLFLVTGVSFVMAVAYLGLAWWARSSHGTELIRSHFQQRDTSEEALTKQHPSTPSWAVRIAIFLISNRPRFWIQSGLMGLCLLAAILQACKIRGASNCDAAPIQYHDYCSTTKAAVVSTFLTGFCWMLWLGWLLYKSRSSPVGINSKALGEAHNGDVLISMPDERRVAEMTEASLSVSRGSSGPSPSQYENNHQDRKQQPQQNKQLQGNQSQAYIPPPLEKSQQHVAPTVMPIDPSASNSFGLGIDIYTKNASESTSTKSENGDAGISSAGSSTAMPNTVSQSQSSLNRFHQNSVSLSGINHIRNISAAGLNNIPARSRSNSIRSVGAQSTGNINGRLRDHAKIFAMPRSSASSIHEAYSNRGTPMMQSASRDFAPGSAYSLHRANASFSSNISTPTTPLSRGEMGYMGAHTMKALNNNFTRSVSMGHIAAFNNAMAGSTATSPVAGTGSMPHGSFEPSETPISVRSQSMLNLFGSRPLGGYCPQTPAEAEAAENSMDEHLRAIRRQSVATEVMNSPYDIDGNATSGFTADGATSPAMSSRAVSFRMSFSSPNLSSSRRRSSLGLKSVLSSIVPPTARSDSSDSISSSEVSSPCLTASPQGSDSAHSVDGRPSFETHSKQHQTVTAQELLQAEYGDFYSNKFNAKRIAGDQHGGNNQASANGVKNIGVPGASRPRSASVSSDSTTKTSSSGYSDSTSSTTSNMTSLSIEERRAVRAVGPPRAFLNRLKIGHHRKSSQQYPQRQKYTQDKGSNDSINEVTVVIPARGSRSGNNTPISKKFPSNGDLAQFSWDYRREMPVD